MAKFLRGVKWVATATVAPVPMRYSRIARPNAAPSWGSVPAPSSSRITRVSGSASRRISTMFTMCEEKVESDCSIDCSSPISDRTFLKTLRRVRGDAGMGIPAWARSVKSPMVFRVTVFPPVLGPVITTTRWGSPMEMVMGTARSPKSGCRTSRSSSGPRSLSSGITAFSLSA